MTDAEATSEEQLDALLRDGRISPEDYDTLRNAMWKGSVEGERRRPAKTRRRLEKHWVGRQLGGVCAGLGEFFGLDAWSVRAVFVLALLVSGGTALIVYLALYFTLPWADRDEVSLGAEKKRRGATRRFLASLVALWVFWILFHLYLASLFLGFQGFSEPSPFGFLVRLSGLWENPFIMGLQALFLGLVYAAFSLAPAGGAVRRWIPRVLGAGILVYCLFWICVLVSASSVLWSSLPPK